MKTIAWLSIGALLLLATGVWAAPRTARARVAEVQYANEDFKLLDTFEAHRLTKADEVFAKGEFRRARSEYDSFILEFPQTKALAYALLRKARCLHLENKRYEAIKAYQEVLDYFPNVVRYAAPAIYFIGLCHWENGEEEKAVSAWAKMAADKEYSRHPLGASAFNELADYLVKQEKPADAVKYYEQVAFTFRTDNPDAANYAIGRVVVHYVRTNPNEAALRAFYAKVKTFDGRPQKIDGDVVASRDYWTRIQEAISRHGEFPADKSNLRDNFFRYWAEAMEGKFLDWDEYQINIAAYRLNHERDTKKWLERLDKQYSRTTADNVRTIRWIKTFRDHKAKVAEYYRKIDFAKITPGQLIDLMKFAYEDLNDAGMGRSLYERLPFSQLADPLKAELGRYFWKRSPDQAKDLFKMMNDKELGNMELLRCYARDDDMKNGLPLAEEMTKSPTFSVEALRIKADLLFEGKEYAKAIPAYQACDNPPANLWRIADCYAALGKSEQAIGQLREVENFFKQHAPEAALRVAGVYKRFNLRDQHIAALRAVLKKYPKSGQSNAAHLELEKLGVRIGGGVDADQ